MNLVQSLLIYFVWFFSTYFVVVFILLLYKYRSSLTQKIPNDMNVFPKVSIVIPAYNEEKAIASTLSAVRKIDYPQDKIEIIVVNDGSRDKTPEIVNRFSKRSNIIFIDNKVNRGKASCLNLGIKKSTGEYVACMDADTIVPKDIIKKTVKYFSSGKTGAVIVGVDVQEGNFLQKITQIEYALGISLSLSILSRLNSTHVTPGPFSIYRKSMLIEIGGFDPENITEDMEIAYRIHKKGYSIKCCLETKVVTEAPGNIKSLYMQRKRWYTGALQTLSQHRDLFFKKKLNFFSIFLIYNYSLITSGICLFIISLGISLYNMARSLLFYRFTNFNFFQNIELSIDLLNFLTIYSLLVLFSMFLSLILAVVGLKVLGKKIRDNPLGFIGFLHIFLLYQVFWIASFYSFIFRRKLEWR